MRVALIISLLLVAAHVFPQDPEGMVGMHPTGKVAGAIHQSGQKHYHIRPFNPFLDRQIIQYTVDSALIDTTQHLRHRLMPILDAGAGLSAHPTPGFAGVGSAGIYGQLFIKDRWFVRAGYQMGYLYFPDHLQVLSNRVGTVQGMGRSIPFNGGALAHYPTGAVGLRMGQHFSLEAGREKHFWGDGYRSMVLSHNATPYEYARLTTKVWRVKYTNLWARMNSFDRRTGERSQKYTAMHAVSWNITPRFNFSIYEAIVWQAQDLLVDRGFDFAYLNPFIFYRPIEFAKGSADNVLLGTSMSYDIGSKSRLYGQLYFDEFVISELRSRNQWWGNKFAIQLGFKTWDVFAEGHSLLSEVNIARPFMYSHGSEIQSYTHDNLALAHPLGANFAEWVTRYHIERPTYSIMLTALFATYANDPFGRNYGNDILRSYSGPHRQYNNYWFQGNRQDMLYTEVDLTLPSQVKGVNVFVNTAVRKVFNRDDAPLDVWLMAGIRTALIRPYRDF